MPQIEVPWWLKQWDEDVERLRAENERLREALATLLHACDWRAQSGDMEPYFQAHHDAVMLLDELGAVDWPKNEHAGGADG